MTVWITLESNSLFKALYVDKPGIFGGPKCCHFSQVKRACEELGIEIIFASALQGKGRTQRTSDTLQDRLVPEFRMRNITNIQDTNEFLKKTFIPQVWQNKFVVQRELPTDEFTSIPENPLKKSTFF